MLDMSPIEILGRLKKLWETTRALGIGQPTGARASLKTLDREGYFSLRDIGM